MTPKLSIVVPFYKVESYLQECLVSLSSQTFTDFEVVMVDDGSPDRSADIAARYAAQDSRFRLVQQENQGLGLARNTGVKHATGTYLAFVDSDDVVARHAYELLVGSLESTGSDIAAGNVARFNSGGSYQSALHAEPFRTTRKKTHVQRRESLLCDRTAWNKVFRRTFWDVHGLEFPPGMYEDIPVTVPAHFLARSVDVFSRVVYYWREREDDASTTQRRTELANMTDRVAAVRSAADFLHANAPARLSAAYDRSVLESDLPMYLGVLGEAGEEYVRAFRDGAVPFLERCAPAARDRLPVSLRLKYHLLQQGKIEELREVLDFERSGQAYAAAPVRRRRRWHAGYPFLGDPEHGVPDSVYRLADRELELRAHLDDVRWRDGRIHVTGHAYVNRLGAARRWHGPLLAVLRRAGTRRARPVRMIRRRRPDVTARLGQSVSYDRSGFELDIDPVRLGLDPRAVWELHVAASARGALRRGPVGRPMPGAAQHPAFHDLTVDGTTYRIHPTFNERNDFVIRAERIAAELTGHTVGDGRLELSGVLHDDTATAAGELVLRRRLGTTTLRVPIRPVPGDPRAFTATVRLDELVPGQEEQPAPELGSALTLHDTESLWEVAVRAREDSSRKLLTCGTGFTETWHASAGREVGVTRTRHGHINLIERRPHLVVDALAWNERGELELCGAYAGPAPYPDRLTLCRHGAAETHDFPLVWHTGDGYPRFSAVLTPGALTVFGRTVALAAGAWDMSAGSPPRPVRIARHLVNDLPGWRDVGLQQMVVRARHLDCLRLSVRTGHADEERGRYAQQRLRTRTYPALRRRPVRDLVLLQSYFGTQYSCNPRAVSEHLARYRPDLELCWVTDDGRIRAPEPARTVLAGTREHYEALSTARYLISNCGLQDWFVKRPDQIYLQTWHGSPLKRIGFDIEAPTFERGKRRMEALGRDAATWDLLVSQSPFTTPILRRAFQYEGDVAEIGYPRTDVLHGPDVVARVARARANLGIPPDRRVILYAPTWRDHLNSKPGKYGFEMLLDLDAVRAALGPDHVVLIRAHHLVNARSRATADGLVRDVSAHPDINELFLAADVLVTDYSSAMFDYAGLSRPILLYTPDLDQYRDTIRGLSFPIEDHAPGPILRCTDEVIDALLDIDAVARKYADDLDRFRATFCPHDDGNATARFVARMLTRAR